MWRNIDVHCSQTSPVWCARSEPVTGSTSPTTRPLRPVVAFEPEPTLRARAVELAESATVAVEVLDGVADALPLADGKCDAVVMSLVMCSVPDQRAALAEVRRVLRPVGELRFYEHVRSNHCIIGLAEDAASPIWSRLAGGLPPQP